MGIIKKTSVYVLLMTDAWKFFVKFLYRTPIEDNTAKHENIMVEECMSLYREGNTIILNKCKKQVDNVKIVMYNKQCVSDKNAFKLHKRL